MYIYAYILSFGSEVPAAIDRISCITEKFHFNLPNIDMIRLKTESAVAGGFYGLIYLFNLFLQFTWLDVAFFTFVSTDKTYESHSHKHAKCKQLAEKRNHETCSSFEMNKFRELKYLYSEIDEIENNNK